MVITAPLGINSSESHVTMCSHASKNGNHHNHLFWSLGLFIDNNSGVHRGCALSLWGPTLKCPCVRSVRYERYRGRNQYRRSLRMAPSPRGAPSQLLKKKKKKTWSVIPAPAPARASCLRLNADDQNWWTTMPVKRHQLSREKKKKKMKTKPTMSLSGRLYSQSKKY